jgi:hypothetical protein
VNSQLVGGSKAFVRFDPQKGSLPQLSPAWRIWPNDFIFRFLTSDAQPHLFGGVEICGRIIVGSLATKENENRLVGNVLEIRRQRSVDPLIFIVMCTALYLLYRISIFS